MHHGRIETTPEQQLAELRLAYARYATLAERWREDSDIDPSMDPGERAALERDARRIAHAYEKTIASTALRLESLHKTHAKDWLSLIKGLSLMLGIAIVAGSAAVLYLRPDIRQALLPQMPARRTDTPIAAVRPVAPTPAPAAIMTHAPVKPATVPVKPVTPAKPVMQPAPSPKQSDSRTAERSAKPAIAPPQAITPPAERRAPPVAAAPTQEPPAPTQVTPAPTQVTPAPTQVAPAPTPVTPVPTPAPQATLPPLSPPRDVAPLPSPPQTLTPAETPPAKPAETQAPSPAAPSAPAFPSAKLVALRRTHTLPPYPIDAKRAGEQGTTQMEVSISAAGMITDCRVTGTSGSQRLDATACSFVQRNWRWQPPMRDGREVPATTKISVIWNLVAGR